MKMKRKLEVCVCQCYFKIIIPIQSLDCAADFSLVVKRMWIHLLCNVAARTAQGASELYHCDVALVLLSPSPLQSCVFFEIVMFG